MLVAIVKLMQKCNSFDLSQISRDEREVVCVA